MSAKKTLANLLDASVLDVYTAFMIQSNTISTTQTRLIPSVVHVAAGEDFSNYIVFHVMQYWPRESWPKGLIFLPNKRSIRSVREAFIEAIGNTSALLPQMIALADADVSALFLMQGVRSNTPPLPIMHPVRRSMLLAKHIRIFMKQRGEACTMHHALTLADALSNVLDESVRYGCDMRSIRHLIEGDFSRYWQESAEFLAIIFEYWPRIESSEGAISRPQATIDALHRIIALWQEYPPNFPIIIAGSTGSQPATARLMEVVASLPLGSVLLPSACGIDASYASAITRGHPLFHISSIAAQLDGGFEALEFEHENARYIARAFRPSAAEDVCLLPLPKTLLPIECVDEWEEARVVSLIVREKMQSSASNIMVVSPDLETLKRIRVALRRYGIIASSSGADRANAHPFMCWLKALLSMIDSGAGANELLAFFQHPLTFAKDIALHNAMLRAADDYYARRLLQQRSIAAFLSSYSFDEKATNALLSLSLLSSLQLNAATLEVWFGALIKCAALFGADAQYDEDVDDIMSSLRLHNDLDSFTASDISFLLDYAAIIPWFDKSEHATHTNIQLHTPIEARLQNADYVILAGLNEQIWPKLTVCPWLNQSMRLHVGLPTYAHELSLQSHDFMQLASSKNVFLTRAKRMNHSVATPSRWWQRVLLMQDISRQTEFHSIHAAQYTGWARNIDVSTSYAPEQPPKPNPLAELRPRELRVTHMEEIMQNPYAVYARSILNLKPLDAIDRDLDNSLFGSLMHKVLENVSKRPNETINDLIDSVLSEYNYSGRAQIFWRERLLRGIAFYSELADTRARFVVRVESEAPLVCDVAFPSATISFKGKADRVETWCDGKTAIVDFKTGSSNFSEKKILAGIYPQLTLYHIAEIQRRNGPHSETGLGSVNLAYWIMPHGASEGEVIEVKELSREDAESLLSLFKRHISHVLLEQNPMLYAPSMRSGRYSYSSLARAAEWGGVDSVDDD